MPYTLCYLGRQTLRHPQSQGAAAVHSAKAFSASSCYSKSSHAITSLRQCDCILAWFPSKEWPCKPAENWQGMPLTADHTEILLLQSREELNQYMEVRLAMACSADSSASLPRVSFCATLCSILCFTFPESLEFDSAALFGHRCYGHEHQC